ncbi:MAG: hypothetical protein Kow00109_14960 [Acidobacteriota bacterium]
MRGKWTVVNSTLAAIVLGTVAFAQPDLKALEGRKLFLRVTPNNNPKVYVPDTDGEVYYIHKPSRLFPVRRPLPVEIRRVKQELDYVEIQYKNEDLGKGAIQVFGLRKSQDFDRLVDTAFAENPGALPSFVLNRRSGVVHFIGCNHLPPESDRVVLAYEDVEHGNYKRCPLCFNRVPRVSGYDREVRLSEFVVGEIQRRYPLSPDDALQQRVREAGKRVLEGWVTPLKGYDYRFYVVESSLTNAFAAPAGKIFVTTALLDTLESDEELEAILAHEIAHVELRHGYRQFRSAQKAAFFVGLAAAVAGAASKRLDVAEITLAMGELAAAIVMTGHSRQYEAESDAFATLFFEKSRGAAARAELAQVLRKLQYHQDFYDPYGRGDTLMSTHPVIEGRIDAVLNSEVAVFPDTEVFHGYNHDDDLVATVSFQGQRSYSGRKNPDDVGLQLIALVETTAALGDKAKIKDIRIHVGDRRIKLDNKEDTEILPDDAVGASFVTKDVRTLIEKIDAIDLELRNVVRWQKESASEGRE